MANRKNYSKISTEEAKAKQTEETKVKSTLEPAEPEVTEEVETQPKTNVVEGVVVDCGRLNVRKEPKKDAEILVIVNKGTKALIDESKSTDEFYCVSMDLPDNITLTEGYCMKKYISIKK